MPSDLPPAGRKCRSKGRLGLPGKAQKGPRWHLACSVRSGYGGELVHALTAQFALLSLALSITPSAGATQCEPRTMRVTFYTCG